MPATTPIPALPRIARDRCAVRDAMLPIPLRQAPGEPIDKFAQWNLRDVEDDRTAGMDEMVKLNIAEPNVRLLRGLWRIVVNEVKHDFAAELAYLVAAEMKIVEAHLYV
jgi:hypothetical protein